MVGGTIKSVGGRVTGALVGASNKEFTVGSPVGEGVGLGTQVTVAPDPIPVNPSGHIQDTVPKKGAVKF